MSNEQHYVSQFASFQNNGAAKSPSWVNELRSAGMSVFSSLGFPTTKLEEWKYTNVAPISKSSFVYASAAGEVSDSFIESLLIPGSEHQTIVLVNGHFSAKHSRLSGIPAGVTVTNLREAYATHEALLRQYLTKYAPFQKNPFTALNTAFINDGVFVHVPEGVTVEHPIHLLFVSVPSDGQSTAAHIRNLIVAEESATVNFASSFVTEGDNTNLTNVVTEVIAKEKSRVELVKVQRESESSYHVEHLHAHQYREGNIHLFSLAVGGAIARNEMSVIIDGESTECNLNGLYITSGEQLIDHHTLMHHIHPNCPSHELFKGILMDKSRAVFNGKVYVEPEAQKTDSKQTNRNLLLSDLAVVDTKPELEIFADDVKCTHGAAVGGMNETHSFYLKTRGITEESARGILTVGFAAETTEKIRHAGLRRMVDAIVVDHLRKKFGTGNLPEIVHA